eukprot:GGOE01027350.1.p2 GENE.GGOE01027350.1~~GGOE01027350.1.p2  ORF type:complete len:120 (-),score=11.20 GGOE01027350.1:36-395(-)
MDVGRWKCRKVPHRRHMVAGGPAAGRPGEGCESNGIAHRYSAASWSLYFLMMLFRFSFRAAVVMSFSGVQASEETCTLVGISKRARLFALPMARKDSRTASRVGFSFFISHVTMATQLP